MCLHSAALRCGLRKALGCQHVEGSPLEVSHLWHTSDSCGERFRFHSRGENSRWRNITQTWLCAENNQVLPLEDCARNVMVNVLSVTRMFVLAHWCGYAMNAIMVHTKVAAWFVVALVSLMRTTARNVRYKRKIEMGVQRLSTWEVQRQISFMKERSMVSKRDDSWLAFLVTKDSASALLQLFVITVQRCLAFSILHCFVLILFFFTSWIRAAALRRMFLTFHPVKHFCLC